MNEQNKNNVKWGLEVLFFIISVSIGVGAGFGCFNYATLAKQVGDSEGIFWLVGLANIGYTIFYGIRHFKKIRNSE